MLFATLALLTAAPAILEKDPDAIVCKDNIDRRTRMRLGRTCKTRAEWQGKYDDEDKAADAAAAASVAKKSQEDDRTGTTPR